MKSLKYLTIIFFFYACNGQDSKGIVHHPKNRQMSTEHFDVSSFKQYQIKQEEINSLKVSEKISIKGDTTIKEYSLISSENGIEYARENIPSPPSLFYSLEIFNEQGIIKSSVDTVFIGIFNFEYGLHNFYDKEGYLTKQIDYHNQFDSVNVKVNDLLHFLSQEEIKINQIDSSTKIDLKSRWFSQNESIAPQMVLDKIKEIFAKTRDERGEFEEKIINPFNRQDVARIHIDFDAEKQIWIVVKDYSSLGKIIIHIDANDKKIIESAYEL